VNQGEAGKTVTTLLFTTLAGLLAAVPFACSSPPALKGNGGQCLQTIDCQQGLFCVPQKNGAASVCTTDLSMIVSTEEAGTQEAAAQVMMDGGKDGTTGDGATSPAPDTGTTKPPADSGSTPEAQPPQDNAAPPMEATAPVPDASSGG
jgi:hypothetical protein